MRSTVFIAMTGIGLLFSAAPVRAHHAFAAEFDATKPLHLVGTVTRVEWINPHAWIHIDVKGADGKVTSWMIEGGAPNTLIRRGVTKATLPVGAGIVVDGFQAKDGTNTANGQSITQPDGTKLFLGSSLGNAPGETGGDKK